MDVYAIVLHKNEVSEGGYKRLVESSTNVGNDFGIERFLAVTPELTDRLFAKYNLKWTWPDSGVRHCDKTKLRQHAYGGRNPKRRHACAWSHYLLWKQCADEDTPILILEHDALFIQKLNTEELLNSEFQFIGINSPHSATRLAGKYDAVVQGGTGSIVPCPEIDRWEVPQGIAGGSSYLIKPLAARQILAKIDEVGM